MTPRELVVGGYIRKYKILILYQDILTVLPHSGWFTWTCYCKTPSTKTTYSMSPLCEQAGGKVSGNTASTPKTTSNSAQHLTRYCSVLSKQITIRKSPPYLPTTTALSSTVPRPKAPVPWRAFTPSVLDPAAVHCLPPRKVTALRPLVRGILRGAPKIFNVQVAS